MTETWRIRPAIEADAPAIARHRYPDLQGENLELYATWVAHAISQGNYLGWLGEAEGAMVAGAGLVLLDWGPTKATQTLYGERIGNVYTEPAWRRRGLATALLQHLLDEVGARGVRVLDLNTSPQARALYERLGFKGSQTEMVKVTPTSSRPVEGGDKGGWRAAPQFS